MLSIAIYFVLLNPDVAVGYVPPQMMYKSNMTCGYDGVVIGVVPDRTLNPQYVMFPDPYITNKHCKINVYERILGLPEGDYEFATTIEEDGSEGRLNYHDPHTSVVWYRRNGIGLTPAKPTLVIIKGEQ